MYFETWVDFLDMGGYGIYVWLSYAICFVALVVLAVQSYRGKQQVFQQIRREQQREQRINQANQQRESL